jgi:LruC domain-containing protein
MKKIMYLIIVLISLHSCKREWDQTTEEISSGIENLKIDPAFDWKLTKDLTIDGNYLTGPGVINITSTDGRLTFYTGQADGNPVTISLPKVYDDVLINGQSFNQLNGLKSGTQLTFNSMVYDAPALFSNSPTYQYDAVKLTDNTFALLYIDMNAGGVPYVKIGTINGNTITYGNAIQVGSPYNDVYPRILALNSNRIAFGFVEINSGNRLRIYLANVNGNNINLISNYTSPIAIYNFEMDKFDDEDILVGYEKQSNSVISAFVLDASTGILNAGPDCSITSAITTPYYFRIDVATLSSTSCVVGSFIPNNGTMNNYTTLLSRNGLILTPKAMHPIFGNTGACPQQATDILRINDTRFLAFGEIGNRTNYVFCNIVGNTIVPEAPKEFLGNIAPHLKVGFINQNTLHLAFSNSLNYDRLSSVVGNITGNIISWEPITNHNIPNFRYMYYYEYMPFTNFMMGDNKLLMLANNFNTNRFGITIMGHYNPPIVDADGDGVADTDDDYPHDPLRAFDNYFPASGFGSLAYEDLWPGKGDYDFNDLVIDYQFHTVTNGQNKVVDITATFVSKASGASLENGFGFSLPEASTTLKSNESNLIVTGSDIGENFITLNASGHESGQSKPTIIVYDNVFNLLPHPGTGLGINTTPTAPFVDFDTIQLTIRPTIPVTISDFSLITWNPFLIVNKNRDHEIHLRGYGITDLGSSSYFGQWEDASNLQSGETYKTALNLPWAIDIPAEFVWPVEKVEITQAHLKFAAWAESSGSLYPDWYLNSSGYRNNANLYEIP